MDLSKKYDIKKATSLAIFIINRCTPKKSVPKINYLKLMKLMYLIERQMLESFERLITNDDFVSMKYGPVLSNTYNAIKNDLWDDYAQQYWDNYIKTEIDTEKKVYEVQVIHQANAIPLRNEEKIVAETILDRFKDYNEFDLVEFAHDYLPEWNSGVGESSSPITINAIKEHTYGLSCKKIRKLLNEVSV